MTKKTNHQTFEYQEIELEKAIAQVEESNLSENLKSILINCLKTCLSINSLLQKNRTLRRLIGRLFGFKSEKRTKKKALKTNQTLMEKRGAKGMGDEDTKS